MNKKRIGIISVLCLGIIGLCYLYTNRSQAVEQETQQENNTPIVSTPESENTMETQEISIRFGTTEVQATLNTSEAAQEFSKRLPMEIEMARYDDREYYAAIDEIATQDEVLDDYENGDIMYYTSGQSLAIFFGKADTASQPNVIKMGSITSDLSIFDTIPDNVTVSIRLIDSQPIMTEEQAIQTAYQERCDAMVNRDIQKLDSLMADDLVLHHISGTTQSKKEWLSCIEEESMKYYNIEIDSFQVQVNGDSASVDHTTTIDARIYGSEGTWTLSGTSHYEKRDGEWIWINSPQ